MLDFGVDGPELSLSESAEVQRGGPVIFVDIVAVPAVSVHSNIEPFF